MEKSNIGRRNIWWGSVTGRCNGVFAVVMLATACAEGESHERYCTESPCGLKPNCGCPPGQKCTLNQLGSRVCLPAGTGVIGTICMNDAECAKGYVCLLTKGVCHAYCDTDLDCSGAGAACLGLETAAGPIPDAFVCSYACDLPTASGCPAGFGCEYFWWDPNSDTIPEKEFTDCLNEVGTGTQGTPCTAETDCAASYWCDTTQVQPICRRYCWSDTDCSYPTRCRLLGLFLGGREVGSCF